MEKTTSKKTSEVDTSSPQKNIGAKKFLNHISKEFQEVFNRRNNMRHLEEKRSSINYEWEISLGNIVAEKELEKSARDQNNKTLKKNSDISENYEEDKNNQLQTDLILSSVVKSIAKHQRICIKVSAATSRIFQIISNILIQIEQKPSAIYLITSVAKKEIYQTQIINLTKSIGDQQKVTKFKIPKILSFQQCTTKDLESIVDGWVFFEAHNEDVFLYEPCYLKIITLKLRKLIIYTDDNNFFPEIDEVIELDDRFPYEIISLKNQQQQIAHIIKQSNLYAQKIDMVIFSVNDEYPQQLAHFLKMQRLHANIIYGPEMKYSPFIINIFVAKSQEALNSWRFSLSEVVAVFDFGMRSEYYFDINLKTYVENLQNAYNIQIIRRFNILGNKPGKYYKLYTHRPQSDKKYYTLSKLPFYILKMIQLGISVDIIKTGKQTDIQHAIDKCLQQFLSQNIIVDRKKDFNQKNNNGLVSISTFQVTNPIFTALYNKILPFFSKILLDSILSQNDKLNNMLVYAISFMMTLGTMNSKLDKKFNEFWRKSGQLQIYIEILYIYESIFSRNQKNIKKQDLPTNQFQQLSELFGTIFQQFKPKQKLTVSKMDYSTFLREYGINSGYLEICAKKVQQLRNLFKFQFQELNSIDLEIDELIHTLFKNFKQIANYTGSRRFGYQIMKSLQKFIPSKKSLISITNERYNIIIPLRIKKNNNGYQIEMCNKISEELYLVFASDVHIVNRKSSFSQLQIEFHNIGTGLFQILWKNDGQYITEFQKKFDCIVEFNDQLSAIIIFCSKTTKNQVQNQFEEMMAKAKKQLMIETKLVDYHEKKLLFQKGGRIREIVEKTSGRILHLVNLPEKIKQEDVRELLEEQISEIQKLQLKKSQKIKNSMEAIITFQTYQDLVYVFNVLNYTEYQGRKIRFEKNEIKAEENNIIAENYVKIKWYAWKSKKNAKIQFKQKDSAVKAAQNFKKHEVFDKNKVKIIQKEESIFLEGINEITDQIFIYNAFSVYGPIANIQIQKNPMQEKSNYENLLQFYIKENIPKDQRFHIVNIKKKSHGLRVAKVKFPNEKSISILCNSLNERIKLIGETRIYVIPYYKHPYLIQKNMEKLYNEFFQEIYKKNKLLESKIKKKTIQKNNMLYVIVKSNNEAAFNIVTAELAVKIKPIPLNLYHEEKAIVLCEMGMQSLEKIENKYNCKFFPNIIKKELSVVCQDRHIVEIMNQIRSIGFQTMTLSVATSMKTFRLLMKKQTQQKLEEIKVKNNLNVIKLDKIGKCIFMQGKVMGLQSAKKHLTFFIQSLSISKQLMEGNTDICGICCEELNHPYRLQVCSHAFCLECLMFSINSSLQDVNMFPIRCPHCLQQLIMKDLLNLLDDQSWNRLQNIAINDYVNRNSHLYMFCYSANCPGIHKTTSTEFECKICQKNYCTKCKQDRHPGMTCQQAKEGGSALLKKYMEQNDVRICPNINCKMLMQRVDGCYRVTCSRCQQSMCWKCPRDKMPIYVTADQCYKHLTKEHGGYW